MKILYLLALLLSISIFAQNRRQIGSEFIISLLQKKDYGKSRDYLDASIKNELNNDELQGISVNLQEQLGNFKEIIEVYNQENTYYFYSQFEKSRIDIQLTFNENNKIVGFFFVPHKEFSDVNDTSDSSLKIKSENITLKGNFLNPPENSQKKIAVFLHGSGPNDRDETIGQNKPFKDIAEFLFSKGISSYRFDKRTYSYPETFDNNATVEQETINDALNIIQYFRTNYKDFEVILIGHSLGGYLLPKIMENKPDISKLIFLAANARPLDKLIIEQLEYMHKVDSQNVPNEVLEDTKKKVKLLNSKNFNLNTPKSDLPFGLSAKYWKYLLDYKPLELVKKIDIPMFFAQGGKDYQVTDKDFNLWKQSLKECKKCQFNYYPSLNHIFITGGIIPSPKDYDKKEYVNQDLLEEVTTFILK